jgi:Inosine-uridine preferring nucleoside hydrolase
MRDFLIDTDTASDDAVAIIMALSAEDVNVLALTTVAGNVGVERATRNALLTADICGSDVPVFAGAGAPLVRRLQDAHWFHGNDGLGDHSYPAPRRSPEHRHAIEAIRSLAHAEPGLTLVTLGPLTNIALAYDGSSSPAPSLGTDQSVAGSIPPRRRSAFGGKAPAPSLMANRGSLPCRKSMGKSSRCSSRPGCAVMRRVAPSVCTYQQHETPPKDADLRTAADSARWTAASTFGSVDRSGPHGADESPRANGGPHPAAYQSDGGNQRHRRAEVLSKLA